MKLHLPKKLLAAVMALFAMGINTTMGADVISINFAADQRSVSTDATGSLNGVGAANWNNIKDLNVSGANLIGSGGTSYTGVFTLSAPGTWSMGIADNNTIITDMQYGYIDLANWGNQSWKVTLNFGDQIDAEYNNVDLVLYFSGDRDNKEAEKYSAVNIGGTYYKGGTNEVVDEGETWGDRSKADSATLGDHNTIKVTNVNISNEFSIQAGGTSNRSTISGMQIFITDLYNEASLTAGDNIAENIIWTTPAGATGYYTDFEVSKRKLQADITAGNASLKFEDGAEIARLSVIGGNTLTVKTKTEGGVLNAQSFNAEQGNTLFLDALLENGSDIVIDGKGKTIFGKSMTLGTISGTGAELYIDANTSISVTNFNFSGSVSGGEGAALNLPVAEGESSTLFGITVTNNGGTVLGNGISGGNAEFSCSDGASIGVSSTGGTLLIKGEEDTKVTLDSLVLNGSSETSLTVAEGVTLTGDTLKQLVINNGQSLTVGKGVNLSFQQVADDSSGRAIVMGSATLNVDGGSVVAESICMAEGQGSTSNLVITNGGYMEITGSDNDDGKHGSICFNHWQDSNVTVSVTDGEFRSMFAKVSIGESETSTTTVLTIGENGEMNIYGLRMTSTANVTVEGTLNIGEDGITNPKGVLNVNGGKLGALNERGWSSAQNIVFDGDSIIYLSKYDVDNKSYSGNVDIALTGTLTGSGTLTLAGSGRLLVSQALAHDVASTGGKLAIADFSGFKAEQGTATGYTGYGDSTTDGYATGGQYRVVGAGSTIDSVTVFSANAEGENVENVYTVTNGLASVTDSLSSEFFVNTNVTRSNIGEVREGTFFTMAAGAQYHTTVIEDLGKLTVADDTAAVYVQNDAGTDLLKITNVPNNWKPNLTVENNTITCSAPNYSANFTVLSGATLKQSDKDNAGLPLYEEAGKERTITVQNNATFDISGKDACYHVILEGDAILTNSVEDVGMDKRNTPIIELTGNATVQADYRLGMLGSGYAPTTLTLNNNTLTKTGTGTFHLNNCTVDSGTIEILAGTVAITEKDGQNSSNGTSDISAATFKVGKSTIGTGDEERQVQGMLSYSESAKGKLEVGHIIAAGGVVLAGADKEIVVSKLSGVESATDAYVTKLGQGTLRLADDIKISDDITVYANVGTFALGSIDITTGKTLTITGTATANVLTQSGAGLFSATELNAGQVNLKDTGSMNITTLTADTVGMAGSGSMTVETMITKELGLTGTGSMNITTLTADTVGMAKNLNITTLAAGATVAYTDVDSIGSISTLGGETIIDLFGVIGKKQIDLGIAYTDENLGKLQFGALEGTFGTDTADTTLDYLLTKNEETGTIVLQATGDDAAITLATDWDINWGAKGLAGQPTGSLPVAALNSNTSLVDTTYNTNGVVAVSLGANGITKDTLNPGDPDKPVDKPYTMICGGMFFGYDGAGSDISADVWIHADGGAYNAIVGGNMSGNWGGTTKDSSFSGDTHILIDDSETDDTTGKKAGDLYVRTVIGGNFADPSDGTTNFTDNTYVSVYTDSVGGGIIGASTLLHGGTSQFTGNSHVYVYAPLTDDSTDYRGEGDKVIGGAFSACGIMNLQGATSLLVDLSGYNGSATLFDKKVIGGMVGNCFSSNVMQITQTDGTINLTVKGTSAAGDITFSDDVIGGAYFYTDSVGGDSISISDVKMVLDGGIYGKKVTSTDETTQKETTTIEGGLVVGGVMSFNKWSSNSTIIAGDIDLSITNGTYNNNVIGGVYHGKGGTSTVGDVTMSLTGGTYNAAVVGGMYRDGSNNTTFTAGDISLTINSGTYKADVVGGSYMNTVASDTGWTPSSNIKSTTLTITGGTFSGKVIGGDALMPKWFFNSNVGEVNITIDNTYGEDGKTIAAPPTFQDHIIGGTYKVLDGGSDQVIKVGKVNMTLNGGSMTATDKLVVGGSWLGDTGTASLGTIAVGDIALTITGGSWQGILGGSYVERNNNYYVNQSDIVVDLQGGSFAGDIYAAGQQVNNSYITTESTTIKISDAVSLTKGKVVSAGYKDTNTGANHSSITGDRTIMFTGDADQDRTGILFSDFNKIGVETAGKTATIGGADITITDALTVIGNGTIKLAEKTGLIATKGITIEKEATVAVNGNAVTGNVLVNGTVNVVGGGALNGMLTLAAGSTLTLWDGTENGTNSVLDMSVPTVEGAALLAEGNVLTIGGLFGLNVKVNLDGEVELVTGLAGIEDIKFDDEDNKVQANTVLSNINGGTVDDRLFLVYEEGVLKLSGVAGTTEFFWSATDTTTDNWSEKLWAANDNDSTNLIHIKDAADRTSDVNAIFNNGKQETVKLDVAATVDDLTVSGEGSDYTFAQAEGTDGSIAIEGTLTVTDKATATFTGALANVGADALEVSDSGALTAGEVTIATTATINNGTVIASSLSAGTLIASDGAKVTADGGISADSVEIGGDATSVTTSTLTVGEEGMTMTGGTLNAGLLQGDGTAEISGGKVTIGGSTLSSTTITGAEFVGNSTLAGAAAGEGTPAVEVAVGGITVGDGDATTTPNDTLNLSNATLTGALTVNTDGTLTIGGKMKLDNTNGEFTTKDDSTFSDGTNGFKTNNIAYHLLTEGSSSSGVKVTNTETDKTTWSVITDGNETTGEYSNGTVLVKTEEITTTYWVNGQADLTDINDAIAKLDATAEKTTTIKLNNGTLKIAENDKLGDLQIVTNTDDGASGQSNITMLAGSRLDASKLDIESGTTILLNTGKDATDAVLEWGDATTKIAGLGGLTTADWKGIVETDAIDSTDAAVNISHLGNANSTVQTSSINAGSLTVGDIGKVHVTGDATLSKGSTTVHDMEVGGAFAFGTTTQSTFNAEQLQAGSVDLRAGSVMNVKAPEPIQPDDGSTIEPDPKDGTLAVDTTLLMGKGSVITADTLTVGAAVTMGEGSTITAGTLDADGITLGEGTGSTVKADELTVGASGITFNTLSDTAAVTAGALTNGALTLHVTGDLLKAAAEAAMEAGKDVAATLITLETASTASIDLNGEGTNVINPTGQKYGYTLDWDATGTNLQLTATANENYMKEKFSGGSANGMAGATLMDEAFANGGTTEGDLEKILDAVDANSGMTDEHMAAIAGSSTAALGMAFAGDVERQLRAIRNRTTTMGVNQCVVNEGMPYFNAWVNAEGNMGELDKDGTYAGYKLDSWGGTIGFDVDVNPNLTLGLAVTAMYGDLTVDGPDMLEGDMDTYYVTAFARYSKRAWTHTFIGTIGKMDGSYERTVNHAGGSYKTEGDTDGMAFGLMYEVGRVYALSEDGDTCLQPVFNIAYRHTTVGGYTEEGGNAALDVDDQTLDTITLGAGARLQAVVGENLYNRTSVLELRALAKLDVGDRASEADVAFIGGGSRATVESAELGAFGVELGAGLSIPVGDENDGTIFFDVSAELRSGYSELNGTVGYRINF